MSRRQLMLVSLTLLTALVLTVSPALARHRSPVGTWFVTVQYPGNDPFQEMLVLHEGGTVSDTVATLRPTVASDGFGVWKRGPHRTIVVKFVKMTFFNPEGDHDGYIVLTATARIDGDSYTGLDAQIEQRIGTDFFNPDEVEDWDEMYGMPTAVGTRLTID